MPAAFIASWAGAGVLVGAAQAAVYRRLPASTPPVCGRRGSQARC
jgi:hypothetical protein